MLKAVAQEVGITGLDLLKLFLKEYGPALLLAACMGFFLGLLIVLIARRRLIPKREGGFKWLNRLYYVLIIFGSCTAFTIYRTVSKIESAGQSFLSEMIEENRSEIDSVELLMKAEKEKLMKKVDEAEQSITRIEVMKKSMGFFKGREAAAALAGIIGEHINVMFLKEGTEIIRKWDELGKPLAEVLKSWSHHKAHLIFKPYYSMVYILVSLMILIPGIEIFVWQYRRKKALETTAAVKVK